nr:class B sortase [uncultured Faecalibacillus sp.]
MKKAIRYILLTVCVCVFCYSAYNLVNIYLNYKKIDDDYGEIAKDYTKETDLEEKESYLQINWDELLQRNKDVKAWIQIPDTNVNYPVLQGETNDTYIHSDIDHKKLNAGSIFVASENEDPFNDFNTVIYGHNMKNGSMFNNIKSYTDQSFAKKHPYIYIYLPDGTVSQYKVVVGHIISESSVLYNTHIVDTASFVQEMVKTSSINVDFDQSQVQSVITLSTCTSAGSESGKRNVVHAILQRKGIDPVNEKMEN